MNYKSLPKNWRRDVRLYVKEGWTLVSYIYEGGPDSDHSYLFGDNARPEKHIGKFGVNYLLHCKPTVEAVEELLDSEKENGHRLIWLGDWGINGQCGWNLNDLHEIAVRYRWFCLSLKGEN